MAKLTSKSINKFEYDFYNLLKTKSINIKTLRLVCKNKNKVFNENASKASKNILMEKGFKC